MLERIGQPVFHRQSLTPTHSDGMPITTKTNLAMDCMIIALELSEVFKEL